MSFPYFDGHNDVLFRLAQSDHDAPETLFLAGRGAGHVDLPRARAGGMVGGLFALYADSPVGLDLSALQGASYDCPLPPPLPRADAWAAMAAQLSILLRIIAASDGAAVLCRSAAEIRAAESRGALAVVLHVEGAEAIDPRLHMLDVLHAAGLRSLGPVWSRPTIFGHGVPMRFPSGPNTGPGLSPAGRRLVEACNRLKIMIDLSHLNEKGFDEVAARSSAPLVATHSNVHALCASSRNLTDRQLAMIAESGGVVGLNFATSFLRPDGQMRSDTGLDVMVDHLSALVDALGEGGVAIGSDFDGAVVPEGIGDVAGIGALFDRMLLRGFGPDLVARIARDNWLDVLERTIG